MAEGITFGGEGGGVQEKLVCEDLILRSLHCQYSWR